MIWVILVALGWTLLSFPTGIMLGRWLRSRSYDFGHLSVHEKAVELDLESLTAARVAIGSASRSEWLGFRFPRIFRKWARENAERDQGSRELHQRLQAMVAELRGKG